MAFGFLHRYVRHALISEMQQALNGHPYYGRTPIIARDPGEFQAEPVNIVERFNFESRQFPIVVVETSSFQEQPLGMDKKITDVIGHSRNAIMGATFFDKVWDDKTYTGTYLDGVHTLEYVNILFKNDEQIMVRLRSRWSETFEVLDVIPTTVNTTYVIDNGSLTIPTPWKRVTGTPGVYEYSYTPGTTSITFGPLADLNAPVTVVVSYDTPITYHAVSEDGRYKTIIPGVEILFGAFNNIRPGDITSIDTFANTRQTGELFGSRFRGNVSIKVYAQTQQQTEELVDMLHGVFLYMIPQRLYYGHGINVIKTDSSDVIDKSGEVGEEAFTGTLTTSVSVEGQFFVPIYLLESYELWLEFRDQISYSATPKQFQDSLTMGV